MSRLINITELNQGKKNEKSCLLTKKIAHVKNCHRTKPKPAHPFNLK